MGRPRHEASIYHELSSKNIPWDWVERTSERDERTASYIEREKHARASDGGGSQERGSASVPTSKVRDMANTEHPCSPEAWRSRNIATSNSPTTPLEARRSTNMAFDFWTPSKVLTASITLRLALLFYGLLQDAFSPLKYTDIDYLVFTDAARYVSNGHSPYCRETYRYTPLLAWLLIPTARPGWFVFGKVVFGAADVVAGWLLVLILRCDGLETRQALRFASIWLLNPMVATISTRGSSEGLLGVIVAALVWAITRGRVRLAGVLLGFGVHFKIYPFIYAPSLFLYLESPGRSLSSILNASRISLTLTSFLTFTALNLSMYALYGPPFLQHTYLHHVSRIDHRHNFSPYNTLLYASSASASTGLLKLESLAFVPQLSLSAVLLPFLAKRHLPGAMLAQTWAFVALNKVCTSQVRRSLFFGRV